MVAMNLSIQTSLSTALVVDDDAYSQAIAKRLLMKLGFTQCEAALDGVEGLSIFEQMARPPDLIICDVFMPRKDGIEFVQSLGKLHFHGILILISGENTLMMTIAEKLAVAAGVHVAAQICKPLTLDQLMQALRPGQ